MAKWRRSSADSQSNFTAFFLENDMMMKKFLVIVLFTWV